MVLIRFIGPLPGGMKMNNKKILAILGSPHMDGTTAAMLNHTIEAAQGADWQVDRVNLYEKQLSFCKGCRACLHTGMCIQKDDLQEIAFLLQNCDVVILAAPVYWASVPAAVKNLFDRLLGVAMEETGTFPKPRLTGKKYLLLTACNTPFPFSWICGQSRGAVRSMREFFKTAGLSCMGKAVCTNTGRKKALPDFLMQKLKSYWR